MLVLLLLGIVFCRVCIILLLFWWRCWDESTGKTTKMMIVCFPHSRSLIAIVLTSSFDLLISPRYHYFLFISHCFVAICFSQGSCKFKKRRAVNIVASMMVFGGFMYALLLMEGQRNTAGTQRGRRRLSEWQYSWC